MELGAALASSALGFLGQERTNRANTRNARAQMAFQERLSNSAYQRAMQDMKKAGLNPILAGKVGGASSPAGALPNIGNSGAAAAQAAATGVATATQMEKLKQEKMNTQRLEELGLSPMEMMYTPFNQGGSMAINKVHQGVQTWIDKSSGSSAKSQRQKAGDLLQSIQEHKNARVKLTKEDWNVINAQPDWLSSLAKREEIMRSKRK
jgi:hypothetical protein